MKVKLFSSLQPVCGKLFQTNHFSQKTGVDTYLHFGHLYLLKSPEFLADRMKKDVSVEHSMRKEHLDTMKKIAKRKAEIDHKEEKGVG